MAVKRNGQAGRRDAPAAWPPGRRPPAGAGGPPAGRGKGIAARPPVR